MAHYEEGDEDEEYGCGRCGKQLKRHDNPLCGELLVVFRTDGCGGSAGEFNDILGASARVNRGDGGKVRDRSSMTGRKVAKDLEFIRLDTEMEVLV